VSDKRGRQFYAGDIEDAPDFGARVDTGYLLGLAKIKGSVKTLLDIDRVVTEETLESLPPPV
jgi:purine-binding chemotaxis protein CheW